MVDSSEFPCAEFARFIGIYWLLFVGVFHSFLIIARDWTVSYYIVISLSVSWYVSSAQIYQFIGIWWIVSPLTNTNTNLCKKIGVLKYKYIYFVQLWFKYKYIDSNTNTNTFKQIYLPKFTPLHFRKFHWHWSSWGTWWGGLGCWVGMKWQSICSEYRPQAII